MIFTLIIGLAVGTFYAQAQGFVRTALDQLGLGVDDASLPLINLTASLTLASVVLGLLGAGDHPVVLLIGTLIGLARKPILARIQSLRS